MPPQCLLGFTKEQCWAPPGDISPKSPPLERDMCTSSLAPQSRNCFLEAKTKLRLEQKKNYVIVAAAPCNFQDKENWKQYNSSCPLLHASVTAREETISPGDTI
jgi:hypothetical protein